MALRVTINVFSGRPNPVIDLDEAESAEVTARLTSDDGLTAASLPQRLGYRGLTVEQVGAEADSGIPQKTHMPGGAQPHVAFRHAGAEIEDLILGGDDAIAARKLPDDVASYCQQECRRVREESPRAYSSSALLGASPTFDWSCLNAPVYEAHYWNDGGVRQLNNNCYNYATNYRTNTFAQPGRGAGLVIPSLSCSGVQPLAVSDGLVAAPGWGNQCPPFGHLVALVIAPNFDFHWYRKDLGGRWSHKVGWNPATDLDNDDKLIQDPRTAARGPYTEFCGFLVVYPGHLKLE